MPTEGIRIDRVPDSEAGRRTARFTEQVAKILNAPDVIRLVERSTDPADPAEGQAVLWQSDGTGTGDDGDWMVKITAGGTTKTTTLIDFSGL